jgi:hypothetical protein
MIENSEPVSDVAMRCVVFKGSEGLSRWADGAVRRRPGGMLLQVKPEAITFTARCGVVDEEVRGESDPEGGRGGVSV